MKYEEEQIKKFLFSMFAFSDEEIAAMGKQIPMTQDIFNSCMDKCMKHGEAADIDFEYLINEFPEFSDVYMGNFLKKSRDKSEME